MTAPRVVLGVGGGIAAYKAALLLRLFTEGGASVRVVPTEAALRFVGEPTWAALSGQPVATGVWDDVHEVPHVRLGREADLVVVAPATADLLGRAAHGLADDLLTNVLLTARCPVLLAPAMHTEMWQHPAVVANTALLRERGIHVLDPDSGRLTGADTGPGRLPEPERIHAAAMALLQGPAAGAGPASSSSSSAADQDDDGAERAGADLAGRHVVVSAGGTREPLDPVRFLGNASSGRQGAALAARALARGARVTYVRAHTEVPDPAGAHVVPVSTALQLRDAVLTAARAGADAVVMAAAVADFRPAAPSESKIKKDDDGESVPVVELVRNPDVLAGLVAARREGRVAAATVLVGFAAETGDAAGSVLEHGRAKARRKGADLLVVNEVGGGRAFGTADNTVVIIGADGTERAVGPAPKERIADAVWDAVAQLVHVENPGDS
ncbi:bifunctional phosphopantothenoylcysteine decarboxylase/phosphopantothenate synthase [Quadrisphaera oryzae]|uniref:bifunctional phosphopantothenoylcysteine decarboxylase/phosphopantothenate synthase n=1 Tax=Quadrisphaera TaxID=317661 RepID=UPI001647D200|nr:bifunctional phosphopantothenoylcysteine decarboxylase/phosphopantothenate synthase [Quadrisphaera sp. RL12-1S]MBC3761989.1 bifunctional phosphopantothenoylcysteine decarboxylase/phosphopantothenate synthase [Quadrisphaera sp. RL12-1S]